VKPQKLQTLNKEEITEFNKIEQNNKKTYKLESSRFFFVKKGEILKKMKKKK
jgi:DNA-binding transcriptional regulator GbsR (MarR family)